MVGLELNEMFTKAEDYMEPLDTSARENDAGYARVP
jgi:hypothetical protein